MNKNEFKMRYDQNQVVTLKNISMVKESLAN